MRFGGQGSSLVLRARVSHAARSRAKPAPAARLAVDQGGWVQAAPPETKVLIEELIEAVPLVVLRAAR